VSEIRIRDYQSQDRSAFDRLNRAWLVGHGLLEGPDEEQLRDPEGTIIAPGGRILVAESGETVVGTCAVVPWSAQEFELAKLAVAPAAQGKGVGRRLVEACLAHARATGSRRVVLLSNSQLGAALQLYRSLGFVDAPIPPDNHYLTADVFMELRLA
jgi:ribosomal protein S18 acetylase RimI-like enzyme